MSQNTERIIKEAVRETLVSLGFSADEPHENQADLLYLRKIRKGSEEMTRWIKRSMIMVLIPSFLYMVWEAIRRSLSE